MPDFVNDRSAEEWNFASSNCPSERRPQGSEPAGSKVYSMQSAVAAFEHSSRYVKPHFDASAASFGWSSPFPCSNPAFHRIGKRCFPFSPSRKETVAFLIAAAPGPEYA